MDRTRSGRKVKRSSRFLDMEADFNEFDFGNVSGDDMDYNLDEDGSSEESIDNANIDEDAYYGIPRQSLRNKLLSAEELTWKDGKLVAVPDSCLAMPILKPRQRQKSNITDELLNRIQVVKDDPSTRFYSMAIESLKKPILTYPITITPNIVDETELEGQTQLDLINDEQFNIKLETKNQSLIPKYDKSNDKINELMGLPLDMEDLQRYSRLTGYILFTIVSKKRSENTGPDSGQSHRKIQENWTTMPERTKRDWEIKAKQVKKLVDNKRRNDVIEDASKKEKRRIALKKAEENIKKSKVSDHTLVDLAFYLKTVGEGMSKLSSRIATQKGSVGLEGLESVMLDYLLCSLVSLAGIFEETEGLEKTTTTDSLNKLTFIMPGLH